MQNTSKIVLSTIVVQALACVYGLKIKTYQRYHVASERIFFWYYWLDCVYCCAAKSKSISMWYLVGIRMFWPFVAINTPHNYIRTPTWKGGQLWKVKTSLNIHKERKSREYIYISKSAEMCIWKSEDPVICALWKEKLPCPRLPFLPSQVLLFSISMSACAVAASTYIAAFSKTLRSFWP